VSLFNRGCSKSLPPLSGKESLKVKIPTAALINGYYKGSLPDEIGCLNTIELSMIQIYSSQTTIVIQGGKFHHKISAVYNMVNDVARIAECLPTMPDCNSIAILRYQSWKASKDYSYRPGRVRAALIWLKANNPNYETILYNFDLIPESDVPIEVESMPMEEDVNDELDPACNMDNSRNDSAGSIGEAIMLLSADSNDSGPEQQLRNALNNLDGAPVLQRSSSNVFVNCYNNNFMFWEKSNVSLFPYGKGGPSSSHIYGELSMPMFHTNCLMQGLNDGRRCQSNPQYIFLAYETEMKRKIGSVSMLASKSSLNQLNEQSKISDVERDPTTDEIEELQEYLDLPALPTSDVAKDKEMSQLMNRLIPFAKALNGSALGIANERKKLLCMISSPVVIADGDWQYFLTFAPADVYDHKLFDILIASKRPFDYNF